MKNLGFRPFGALARPGLLALLALIAPMTTARGDDAGQPPFDFSDAFYRANGINPANILARVDGTAPASTLAPSPDANHRNVRVLATNGGFDAGGDDTYFNILGVLMPNAFTNNAAGRKAQTIANHYRAFVFPKAAGDPLDQALPNRRQDNVFDTRDGYFSNDPLGLWILTFVSYTPRAFNTADGRKALSDLAQRNGLDLDGTPMLTKADDIDNLAAEGFVELRHPALDGSQGFPWVLCHLIKDPRGGAITPDAFLLLVRTTQPDGTPGAPLVPDLLEQFLCLQETGDWCE